MAKPYSGTPASARIAGKYVAVESGCWEWTAGRTTSGYGRINDSTGRFATAHRVMYEMYVGPIPDGLELDHLCRNRSCVNPEHLEAVTHTVNMQRAVCYRTKKATHCKYGHELTADNALGERRRCRQCHKDKMRRYRETGSWARRAE